MSGGDQPGIGVAGERGGLLGPVDDRDLVPVLQQLMGGGDADDARAQHQCPHGRLRSVYTIGLRE
jgi:hypothetical protein